MFADAPFQNIGHAGVEILGFVGQDVDLVLIAGHGIEDETLRYAQGDPLKYNRQC